ncbi:glycosyltransferase family 2 protein [Helicobacter sp. 16-1353]|uniref:glycosyltransferase family 2 protein n=1 Tax=Helicobacter sp. 16-1353 TaxID=2004996 RepID=UPI00215BA7A1|nr:glycosyltransferase family 2 protein [Helicobacter sp. 16-1353]
MESKESKKSYEIIVVENPSVSSQTSEFLESYRGKITYYKNAKNLNLFGNWNRCISLAKGKWVCILHDDDILLPNYLSEMKKAVEKVEENTALISHRAIYFGNLDLINYRQAEDSGIKKQLKKCKSLFLALKSIKSFCINHIIFPILGVKKYKLLDKRSADYIAKYNPLHPSAMLHNKEVFLKLGGYNQSYFPSDDWFCHIRCAENASVYQLDKFLSKYRYSINLSFNKDTMFYGSIVNFLHTRDNLKINKRLKNILFQKQYENVLKIQDENLKNEILKIFADFGFKQMELKILDRFLYRIYRMHDVEIYKVEK